MMIIKEAWRQWFRSFLIKKSSGSGITNESNYQLANELHKPIIKKFEERKVYSSFRDNIWGVDLADMQSLSKYNRGIKYLLCAIDLFSRYAWVISIKDKKGTTVVNAVKKLFQKKGGQIKYGLIKQVNFTINLLKIF